MKSLSIVLLSTMLLGMASAHEVGDHNWDAYAAFDGAEVIAVVQPDVSGVFQALVDASGNVPGSIREVLVLDSIKSPPTVGIGDKLLIYQSNAPRGKMAMVIPGPQIFFLRSIKRERSRELMNQLDDNRALYEFVEPDDQWKSWIPLPSTENWNVGRLGAIISGAANFDRSSKTEFVAYLKFLQNLTIDPFATIIDANALDPLAKDLLKHVREHNANAPTVR